MLTLDEEVLLLALHEEKGAIVSSVADDLGYGLAGAILAELALHGSVKVEDSHRLHLAAAGSAGDETLDEVLDRIANADKTRKVGYWVQLLSEKPKKMIEHGLQRLEQKGVLRQEDARFYPVIPYVDCQEQKGSAKYCIKARLRSLALTDCEPDLRSLALVSLAQACNLMDLIFTKDERKSASRRIYTLLVEASLQNPVAQTIDEISRAVESLSETD